MTLPFLLFFRDLGVYIYPAIFNCSRRHGRLCGVSTKTQNDTFTVHRKKGNPFGYLPCFTETFLVYIFATLVCVDTHALRHYSVGLKNLLHILHHSHPTLQLLSYSSYFSNYPHVE